MKIPPPMMIRHGGKLAALTVLISILFFIVPLANKTWVNFVKEIPFLGSLWVAIMGFTPRGQAISIAWIFLLLFGQIEKHCFPDWPGKQESRNGFPENYEFESTDFDLSSTKSRFGLFLYCWPGKIAALFSLFLLLGILSGVFLNGGKHV